MIHLDVFVWSVWVLFWITATLIFLMSLRSGLQKRTVFVILGIYPYVYWFLAFVAYEFLLRIGRIW